MDRMASKADLCYNKHIKSFDQSSAGNTLWSGYNLFERSHHGHSILFQSALQTLLCFPLDTWRKDSMSAPKDPQKREEWLRNLRESHKGQIRPKGILPTPEARAKMSLAKKGRKLSPEARTKAIETLRNIERKPMSEETKAKISASKKGKKNPSAKGHPQLPETRTKIGESLKEQHAAGTRSVFGGVERIAEFNRTRRQMLGKHHSEASKKKSSLSQKGRKLTEEHKRKLSKPSPNKSAAKKGKPRSPETIAKMSAATKAHYASLSPEEKGIYNERRNKGIHTKDTNIEVYVSRQLDKEGILYEQQKRVGRYVVDFLLAGQNLIIEVNGCYWHGCELCGYNTTEHLERRAHDEKRAAYLAKSGYMVAVLWQHDLLPFMKAEGNNTDGAT